MQQVPKQMHCIVWRCLAKRLSLQVNQHPEQFTLHNTSWMTKIQQQAGRAEMSQQPHVTENAHEKLL